MSKSLVIAEIVEELRADGSAGRLSDGELEALAGQISRLRDAQSRIAEEGLIVADGKQNPVPHPALAIEKAAQEEIRKWSPQLGRKRG